MSTPRESFPLIFAIMYNGPSSALKVSLESKVMQGLVLGLDFSIRFTTLLDYMPKSLEVKLSFLDSTTLVE